MEIRNNSDSRKLAAQVMQAALERVLAQLDVDLDELFLEDKWPWMGGLTQRRSGEVVGSPRNIYDLGNLYRSETQRTEQAGTRIIHTREWEAISESGQDYAPAVHDGTSKTDARPWTDRIKVEKEQIYAQLFAEEFARLFNAGGALKGPRFSSGGSFSGGGGGSGPSGGLSAGFGDIPGLATDDGTQQDTIQPQPDSANTNPEASP